MGWRNRMKRRSSAQEGSIINPDLLNNDKSLRHLVDQFSASTAELQRLIELRKGQA